jgi:hypothetical protein
MMRQHTTRKGALYIKLEQSLKPGVKHTKKHGEEPTGYRSSS